MAFTPQTTIALARNQKRWKGVILEVAKARGCFSRDELRQVRLDVHEARQTIGYAAQKIIGASAASDIEDWHYVIGSSPPKENYKQKHFKGISLRKMTWVIRRHLASDMRPEAIEAVVGPYLECDRPCPVIAPQDFQGPHCQCAGATRPRPGAPDACKKQLIR